MARSIADLDTSTNLRKSFEQLLEALDNAGFTIAAAHTDLALHAFENELINHRHFIAHGVGLLLPGEVPMWRAGKGQESSPDRIPLPQDKEPFDNCLATRIGREDS